MYFSTYNKKEVFDVDPPHTAAAGSGREGPKIEQPHCGEKAAVDIMMSCSLRLNMRSLFMRIMVLLLG